MATEKLYYQDAHQAAFEARVVSCQPGKHGYDVVLAFIRRAVASRATPAFCPVSA